MMLQHGLEVAVRLLIRCDDERSYDAGILIAPELQAIGLRIHRWGIHLKSDRAPKSFSERYGYVKYVHIPTSRWRVRLYDPKLGD